jgi:hypothetical protein
MDKNIYLYLLGFVIIYIIFRLNSPEHFDQEPMNNEEPVTIYIKSKYNIENDLKEIKLKQQEEKMKEFKIKEDQIRQLELAKNKIADAKNQELSLKKVQEEARLKELEYERRVKHVEEVKSKAIKAEQAEKAQRLKIEQEHHERILREIEEEERILKRRNLEIEKEQQERNLIAKKEEREKEKEEKERNLITKLEEEERNLIIKKQEEERNLIAKQQEEERNLIEKEEQIIKEKNIREKVKREEEEKNILQEKIENRFKQEKIDNKSNNEDGFLKNTYDTTKLYAEKIQQKIYEFMGTPSTIFNTAKTCGFSYNLYQNTSVSVTTSTTPTTPTTKTPIPASALPTAPAKATSEPISPEQQAAMDALIAGFSAPEEFKGSSTIDSNPPLQKGQMYITNDHSKLIIHYADKLGVMGINIPLSGNTLIITDGVSRYQISINNFNSNFNSSGLFSVNISLSGIPTTFFNSSATYILFECVNPNEDELLQSNITTSFYVFLGLVVFSLLIINYKQVYEWIIIIKNYIFPPKMEDHSNKIQGGKNIFYVGGYDYRDYSD